MRNRSNRERYNHQWRSFSKRIREEWVAGRGWVCPGFRRDEHPSTDLVVDHDLGVLCRACNAHKANTVDRGR